MICRPMYVDKIMAYVDTEKLKEERNVSEEVKTEKREYNRLLEIHYNYPKYVLTTDEFAGGNYEGIKIMHIADFLLSSEY